MNRAEAQVRSKVIDDHSEVYKFFPSKNVIKVPAAAAAGSSAELPTDPYEYEEEDDVYHVVSFWNYNFFFFFLRLAKYRVLTFRFILWFAAQP